MKRYFSEEPNHVTMAMIAELAEEDVSQAVAATEECIREAWEHWMKGYYPEEAIESDLVEHTPETYNELIQSPDSFILSAKEDGTVVGVATGEIEDGGGVARLRWMGIIPGARNRGIGNQLLESIENLVHMKGCHKIFMVVLPCLTDAVRLCYRRGWVPECNLTRHSWKVDMMVVSKWFD